MSLKWQTLLSSLFTVMCATTMYGDGQEGDNKDGFCGQAKRPNRVTARHIEPNGIGYNQGYTTLEGFFSPIHPFGENNQWLPFLDLRGHVFNSGRLAANAGVGLRYIGQRAVFGINGYYDYRNTKRQHYNQVAAGLEAIGKVWDFRINGYLPVGKKTSRYYHTRFEEFSGHSLILSRKKEFAFRGANAEIGVHIDHFKSVPFYFAAGPYYLNGQGKTTWGGQARARIEFWDYFCAEGNVSYDHLFRWIGQGQLGFTIPFGGRREVKRNYNYDCSHTVALTTRALQKVDRFEMIPVHHKHVYTKAIDPVTGDPYVFWFVDNTSHSLGTFESPYPELMTAQLTSAPNDIIFVFVGDGTSNGMNSGITLQDGQRLWGSVVSHTLPTTVGTITIPTLQNGNWVTSIGDASFALVPVISNLAGDVVTIANNNEISGISIYSPAGNAVVTPTTAVANLTIEQSSIRGTSASFNGLDLTNLNGTLLVQSNEFAQPETTFSINLSNTSSTLSVVVLNNAFETASGGLNWTLVGSAQGNVTFSGNHVVSGGEAVAITQSGTSTLTASLVDNLLNVQDSSGGFSLAAGGSSAVVSIAGNAFYTNASTGTIFFDQTSGTLTAVIQDNLIQAPDSPAIAFTAAGADATLTITGNSINSNGVGIDITQTSGALTTSVADNQISSLGTSGGAFSLVASGTNANVNVIRNTLSAYDDAIYIEQTTGFMTGVIDNNEIYSTADDGMELHFGAEAILTISNNTLDTYYHAMSVAQTAGSFTATISNNTFDSVYGNGVTSTTTGDSQSLILTDNVINQGGVVLSTSVGTSAAFWQLAGNRFNPLAYPTEPAVSLTSGGTAVCVEFNNNIAYPIQVNGLGTYQFTNSGGTFTYSPLIGNTGQFSFTGPVVQGACE